jgi:protein required for attachment to host cells
MRPSTKLLFVLTDGGRARLVRRSATTGHFETVEEMDGLSDLEAARKKVRDRTLPQAQSAVSPQRSSIGRDDPLRAVKERFLDRVAKRAASVCRQAGFSGVFIAAPPRLISPLRARLQACAPLAGALAKDLTRTPVERLEERLGRIIPALPSGLAPPSSRHAGRR